MADAEKKEEGQSEAQAGVLLQCGATDWYSIGRSKDVRPEYPNLSVPHRLKALEARTKGAHARGSWASPALVACGWRAGSAARQQGPLAAELK